MNYFELLEIPICFKPDKDIVRKKYFELSKKYHPDFFVNTSQEEQQSALEMSTLLNKAYKTFNSPNDTIYYVLKLKELVEDEEKYQLPADFLMEMMEINEEVSDISGSSQIASITQKLAILENKIYEPVQNTIENYQEGVTSQKELLQVKDYYFKKKYLQRLHHQLEGKL